MQLIGHWRAAEPVAEPDQGINPEDAPERIPKQKATSGHIAHSGREGDEGAHQRYEPSENDGERAFLREIVASGQEVPTLEPPAVWFRFHGVSVFATQPVAGLVANDRRDRQRTGDHPGVEVGWTIAIRDGEYAGGDEQRVSGQEEAREQSRLCEDDQAHQADAARLDGLA